MINHRLNSFFDELIKTLKNYKTWGTFAIYDIKLKYTRSKLGFYWSFFNTAIWILALFVVFKNVFGQEDTSFLLYMAIGIIFFNFLESSVTDTTNILITNRILLLSINLPVMFFFLRSFYKNFLIFLLSGFIYLIILFFVDVKIKNEIFYFPIGLLIFCIFLFSLNIIIGVWSARFRDLIPLTHISLRILFIITPVFWTKNILKEYTFILDYNPFYYFLELVRNPLIGKIVHTNIWIVSSSLTFVSLLLAFLSVYKSDKKIKFWL